MVNVKKAPILLLFILISGFLVWNELFDSQEFIRVSGISSMRLIAGFVGFIWVFQTYRKQSKTQKNFWLFLSMGLFCSSIANFLWLYIYVTDGVLANVTSFFFFWIISSFLFLGALVYKAKNADLIFSNKIHLFNILIYLVTAVAIIYHFLIDPMLANPGIPILAIIYTIASQIVTLMTFFIILLLYYFVQFKKEENILLLLLTSFLLQLIANFLFLYLSISGSYRFGSHVDLLWVIALLLIGFTGFYSKELVIVETKKIIGSLDQQALVFPYISILVLIALVSYNNRWNYNGLSVGLLLTIFMVLGLQIFVIHKNHKLMGRLGNLAYHDPLTGLANRSSYTEDLKVALSKGKDKPFAMLMIDINRFKKVNDAFGHHVGDKILVETAERLKNFENAQTQLYRLEGDEFVLILSGATEMNAVLSAKSILASFQKPFQDLAYEITLSLSIGVSMYPNHGVSGEELLKNADAAMYLSKKRGENECSFYSMELQNQLTRKTALETHIQHAIADNQLSLAYQPKVDLKDGTMTGMEALLRWNHPELGWISPAEFIPLAEETGHIISIGEWVLRTACYQNKRWQEQGLPAVSVSVNVSVSQFQNGQFLKTVEKALKESKLEAPFLELEITESIMQNTQESIDLLNRLKKLGVKTSIDDFGTGYSSLHVLQKLPIDILKVDKSFIDEVGQQGPYTMVKAIIELGLNLNLTIVAEGIETQEQLQFLQENGCTIGQGYLFSKPVSAVDFEELLKTGIAWKRPTRKGSLKLS